MAVKSVIDIQINDEKFKQFTGLFEKYNAALKEMPAGWAAVNEEIAGAKTIFEIMVAAMLAQSQLSEKVQKNSSGTKDNTAKTAAYWKDMARSTKDVAGNIVRATTSLLKWIGLTSVFTGLLGAGGLFGIDRMASSVASGRRSSQGLGVTYGQQKAFGINFGSVVDTGAYLGAVNEALHSWGDKKGLFGAGMTPAEMKGGTAQVGVTLLEHLKRIADSTSEAGLTDVARAKSLDQFGGLDMLMRLKAMTPESFKEFKENYAQDQKDLDLGRDTQSKWVRFLQQMDRAGDKIENVFVTGLVGLADPLKNLSASFVHLVEALGNSPEVKKWLGEAAVGIEGFAKAVGTDEFRDKVLKFTHNVGVVVDALVKLGEGILKVAAWFGIGKEEAPTAPPAAPARPLPGSPSWNKDVENLRKGSVPIIAPGSVKDKFAAAEKAAGLPAGLLWGTYGAESSYGADKRTSKAGAIGPMQIMPATAAAYPGKDPRKLDDAIYIASMEHKRNLEQFGGNIPKAAAAYNWGSGNMAEYLKSGVGTKGQPMPDETKDYVAKILRNMGLYNGPQAPTATASAAGGGIGQQDIRALVAAIARQNSTTKIEIRNSSGANVFTQASQLAFPAVAIR